MTERAEGCYVCLRLVTRVVLVVCLTMCSILVTGSLSAHAAPPAQAQVESSYHAYVVQRVTDLVANVTNLSDDIRAGNLAAARADYLAARKLRTDTQALLLRFRSLKISLKEMIGGSVDLMDEVSTSKMSGEEERYSHLDVAVMAANVQGAHAVFALIQPTVQAANPTQTAKIVAAFSKVNATIAPLKRSGVYVVYGDVSPAAKRALSQAVYALGDLLPGTAASFKQ